MAYRSDIPGQISEAQLKAIELVAPLVPRWGTLVEVGSLFGRSSWAWAKSAHPTTRVVCIDPWENNAGVRSLEETHNIKYGVDQFKKYLSDCPNALPLKGYSPNDFQNWTDPIDLYYEDAVHVNPILDKNLGFWIPKLKLTGIVCGDDYRPRFADVRAGAERYARILGRELIRVDFFWCLLPPEEILPGSAAVAERLRELSAAVDAEKREIGIIYSIHSKITELTRNEQGKLSVPVRLANDSIEEWPVGGESGNVWRVGARLTQPNGQAVVAEVSASLGLHTLMPDIPVDIDIELDGGSIAPGDYAISLGLVDAAGQWVTSPLKGGGRTSVQRVSVK